MGTQLNHAPEQIGQCVNTGVKTGIMVLGFHRSGTSAITRIINLLGASIPSSLLPPQPDNPTGFWESQPIIEIHERFLEANNSTWSALEDLPPSAFENDSGHAAREQLMAFLTDKLSLADLWIFKDPRLCILLPLWLPVLERLGIRPVYLLPFRNPLEVASSLKKRNGFDISYSLLLWLRHTLAAERQTRGTHRAFLPYGELLKDWESCAGQIGRRLQLTWPIAPGEIKQQVGAFLSPDLHHEEATLHDLAKNPEVSEWVKVVYYGLRRLEVDPSADVSADLDRIGQSFQDAVRNCGPYLRLMRVRLSESTQLIAERGSQLDQREELVSSLKSELAHQNLSISNLNNRLTERDDAVSRLQSQLEHSRLELASIQHQLALSQALVEKQGSAAKSMEEELALSISTERRRAAELGTACLKIADLESQFTAELRLSNERNSAIRSLETLLAASEKLSSDRDSAIKSLESLLGASNAQGESQKAEIHALNSRISDLAGQLAISKVNGEQCARELDKINRRFSEKLRRGIRAFRKQTRPLRYFLMGKQVPVAGSHNSWQVPAYFLKTEKGSVAGFIKAVRRKTRPVRYLLMGKEIKSGNAQPNTTAPRFNVEYSTTAQPASETTSLHMPLGLIDRRRAALAVEVEQRIRDSRKPAPTSTGPVAGPTISIIMPVYNTPPELLDLTLLSVRSQENPNWELCICDDGSSSVDVADTVERHAKEDPRIRFVRQEVNKGISAASNAALALAGGEFVGLLDHDDVLLPHAVAQIQAAIAKYPDADMLYTDEAIINEDGSVQRVFVKPDWSPALLTSVMYTGHFSVYRRSLLDAVGEFRSKFDFSQDYDLAFRASEAARRIVHVPHVAYAWRAISGSAAAGGKPFARATNIAALTDALLRRSLPAHGEALPSSNRAYFDRRSLTDFLSIIIPSDDERMIGETIGPIRSLSTYKNYEILVVTKSALADRLRPNCAGPGVRYVEYDNPFNFSDKCNAGAAHARGDVLLFLNDDVRVITADWIETLLECLHLGGVGAASPKLIYDNGLIQHAGMVVGVRRLVGTAFHCLPSDSGEYFNMAQSTRDVSLLSGACLAVPADVFRDVGGFDAKNTPIAHSDVDLCLRVRARGLSCVYTPHATLRHTGHVSIGSAEKAATKKHTPDKADIFLLRRWCREISYDPFFPRRMRDLVYHDSPEYYEIHAPSMQAAPGGLDVLLISHDLSRSGAPRALVDMAKILRGAGNFVVVTSPVDGPHRDTLLDIGIPVIIDSHVLTGHDTVVDFGKNFDIVIGNTVLSWRDVQRLSGYTRTYLYSLESDLIPQQFLPIPGFTDAIHRASGIWSVTDRTARHLRPFREDIAILPNPAAVVGDTNGNQAPGSGAKARIVLIGSLEPRKGQDIAVDAMVRLREEYRRQASLTIFGRRHDPEFASSLIPKINETSEIRLGPELTPSECLEEIEQSDIVLLASRDDTLPLVSLDCLALGRVLVCTRETGTSEFIEDGVSGFVAEKASPEAVADALTRAFEHRSQWAEIGRRGREICMQNFTYEIFQKRLLELIGCPNASLARPRV